MHIPRAFAILYSLSAASYNEEERDEEKGFYDNINWKVINTYILTYIFLGQSRRPLYKQMFIDECAKNASCQLCITGKPFFRIDNGFILEGTKCWQVGCRWPRLDAKITTARLKQKITENAPVHLLLLGCIHWSNVLVLKKRLEVLGQFADFLPQPT